MQAFIYRLTMMRSKPYIQKTYGKSFWKQFQALSDPVFHQVSKELPDIGNSIFSFNYAYAPSCGVVSGNAAAETFSERSRCIIMENE